MSAPTLSIITAVFNGAATIEKLIESVRLQKGSFEFIVIDGGSRDRTMEIVHRHADIVTRSISEPDKGIYDAWNKGLALARGEWIAFIGCDDVLVDGALASYCGAAASAGSDVEFISSRVKYFPTLGAPRVIGQRWRWPAFQERMVVAHVGALHRRNLYDRLGTYDESYRICGDYELLLRARDTLKADFMNRITAHMGGGGISNNQLRATYEETARAKSVSGGRAAWRARLECEWGLAKAALRSGLRV